MGGGTENLRVRREADGGAAPVRRCAQLLQAAGRMPARKALAEQFLVPRDLDHRVGRQRVHHRYAHAMQAAGCRIGLVGEFAARMQRSEEHTSELHSLMRISYAVFCLYKKTH